MNTEKAESSTGKTKLQHKELTGEILGGFFRVYNELGYGFLEHPYSNALSLELQSRGLRVERDLRASNVELGLLLHFGPKPTFKRYTFAARQPVDDAAAPSVAVSVSSA